MKPVGELTREDFDRIVAVNVRGLFVATQEALRHMREGRRIVNIGSINSEHVPYDGAALYVLTKAAVARLTLLTVIPRGPISRPRALVVTPAMVGPHVETASSEQGSSFAPAHYPFDEPRG